MSDDAGEKSFAPTEKRKRDATRKGDVLRSKELGTAAAVMMGAIWLRYAGSWLMEGLEATARAGFSFGRQDIENFSPGTMLLEVLIAVLPPVLALGAVIMVVTVISQLAIGDGRFLATNMAPKASRINPLSGLKRMFGPTGWIELGKSVLKLGLLGAIVWFWAQDNLSSVLALGRGDLSAQLTVAWNSITSLLILLSVGLAVIACIDFPIQWIRRTGRLKMTEQQVRDETKESEGSPEKRAAIRNRQRQLARGGVAKAMQEAQFVLTNPTHFAVALAYDPERAGAPIVLARGRGDKALAMRDIAAEARVPVLEYPVLARSLYFTTRENQVIREELYVAVAAILAFVYSLTRGEPIRRPIVQVPQSVLYDAEGRLTPAGRGRSG
ncbi:EscU/YscU/HrcU family type III secretion system export apparatus switch protein [Croceicoccus sp. F390]|uniref:EscU/YscU/HrcU family type III secretion system export apparatus switch protein n=1 Tax=Croceicoccus esteveae TaxID=3075597 RepID=A0ABU2ZDJ5_9SPHN|nr:EscU/YscU/HrcU family type III secretion system export apparatus switch protein [Croceicoccus sp. F390]MDT0574678.1 EscU/YscU/HrcU family type III secretion system export apparatus switch protein [Croceicoccus sp. F390]